MFGTSAGLRQLSAEESGRWDNVRVAAIEGRWVSATVLEARLHETEEEKRRLEADQVRLQEEVCQLQGVVLRLEAQVRELQSDKRRLANEAWETKHIFR